MVRDVHGKRIKRNVCYVLTPGSYRRHTRITNIQYAYAWAMRRSDARRMDVSVCVYASVLLPAISTSVPLHRTRSQYTDDGGICTSNELPPSSKVRWTINLRVDSALCVAFKLVFACGFAHCCLLFAGIAFRHASFEIQLNEIRWEVSMFIFL